MVDINSADVTVGSLTFDDPANGYTIYSSTANKLVIDAGLDGARIDVYSGDHNIAAALRSNARDATRVLPLLGVTSR